MADLDYSTEARRERRFERDRMFSTERELWRAQYLIRAGTHVSMSREPTEAELERMVRAFCIAEDCEHKCEAHKFTNCWAWTAYHSSMRAAHAALVGKAVEALD